MSKHDSLHQNSHNKADSAVVKARLDQIQSKLLDTSLNNPLIKTNFDSKKGKRLINLVGDTLDNLYQNIQGSAQIKPLPPLNQDPLDEHDAEFQSAFAQAINNSHSSNDMSKEEFERQVKDQLRHTFGLYTRQTNKNHLSKHAINNLIDPDLKISSPSYGSQLKHIQTLQLQEDLDAYIANLSSVNKSWEEETGISVLHIVFGALEIQEPNKDKSYIAPLLLLPIQIEKARTAHGPKYTLSTEYDQPIVNHALKEKLNKEFSVELPEHDSTESVEVYLQKINSIKPKSVDIKTQTRASIGVFPSAQLAMYYDIAYQSENNIDQPLVDALMAGSNEDKVTQPFEEDYNPDRFYCNDIPFLVQDADYSQYSVVIDSLKGHNMAVEGPPGSGKSQTIVNTIAAALSQGWKVLFVAEKSAALDVVNSRMESCGLSEFLLTLQPKRANKSQVIQSIKDRMEMSAVEGEFSEYHQKIERYRDIRNKLADYIDTLAFEVGQTGLSVYEVLGKNIRYQQICHELPSNLQYSELNNASEINETKLNGLCSHFDEIARKWQQTYSKNSPWRAIRIHQLEPFETDKLLEMAHVCLEKAKELTYYRNQMKDYLAYDTPKNKLHELTEQLDHLLKINDIENYQLLIVDNVISNQALPDLNKLLEQTKYIRQEYSELLSIMENPLNNQNMNNLKTLAELTEKHQLDSIVPYYLHEKRDEHRSQLANAQQALQFAREAKQINKELKRFTLEELANISDLIHVSSVTIFKLPLSYLADTDVQQYIKKAASRAKPLKDYEKTLAQTFNLNMITDISDLENTLHILYATGILSRFANDYRQAKIFYRKITNGKKFKRKQAINDLTELINWHKQRQVFNEDQKLANTLGEYFQGIDTDFEMVLNAIDYISTLKEQYQSYQYRSVKHSLYSPLESGLCDLPALEVDHPARQYGQYYLKTLTNLVETLEKEYDQILQDFEHVKSCSKVVDETIAWDKKTLNTLYERANKLQKNYREMQHDEKWPLLLGDYFKGVNTKADDLEQILKVSDCLSKVDVNLARSCIKAIQDNKLSNLITIIRAVVEKQERTEQVLTSLQDKTQVSFEAWPTADSPDLLAQIMSEAAYDKTGLLEHKKLNAVIEELKGGPYEQFLESVFDDYEQPCDLTRLFRVYFYRSLAKKVIREHGAIINYYNGEKLDQLRSDLADFDQALIQLTRSYLKNQLYSTANPPKGNGRGRKSEYTEKALLDHQIKLKRNFLPARKLTSRAGKALQELKPCWMMSPLAVSQYLPNNEIGFDLVIIDEASQMPPENALGALFRSKQLMVVGDNNQLPPTSFFKRVYQDEEVDEDEQVTQDSILEMASATFKHNRRLRWHYRSRHSSLIAFSNHHIYNNDLISFPSPDENTDNATPVELVEVEGAIYSDSENETEADMMVHHIVKHMKNNQDKSLGVVVVNQKQQMLLQRKMDHEFAQNQEAADFRDRWFNESDGLEPFFVKNLESVQGDERDAIFIGTVYGPKSQQETVRQNFGPINGQYGQRRLNVLFTRAKEKIVTFTSMHPEDIQTTKEQKPGAYLLKEWLNYSKNKQLEGGEQSEKAPDSDFEEDVLDQIRAMGYKADPQVGVSGYYIDIGVKNPSNKSGYILGVECDGATYHCTKSSRDRDRLRQAILENLGWRIYRVWSTDWFEDKQNQIDKLRNTLKNITENKN